ncbi:hypothetical protein F4810DRAFT_676908 [Camillea tinctor]|nr:hypothetical protein F4810DRAFT_676908 [Camillea tinctor]
MLRYGPSRRSNYRIMFEGMRSTPQRQNINVKPNTSECICGVQLSSDANTVPANNCKTPCAGDAKLLCGGSNAVAVYSLMNNNAALLPKVDSKNPDENRDGDQNTDEDERQTAESANLPSTSTTGEPQTPLSDHVHMTSSPATTTTRSGEGARGGSSVADPKGSSDSDSGASQTKGDNAAEFPTSAPPGAPAPPASASTIAAITGSMSGAIIFALVVVFCFRAYRRKKKRQLKIVFERRGPKKGQEIQEEQQQQQQARRGVPSEILIGNKRNGKGNDVDADEGDRDILLAALGTTTPVGGEQHRPSYIPHARGASKPPPSRGSERDSLYSSLMHEVRAGPAGAPPARAGEAGAIGLGVDHHAQSPNRATRHPHPSSSFVVPLNPNPTMQTATPNPPNPVARGDGGLGDRAWHRRKLSTPYAPPRADLRAASSSGPPPNVPLPPTPQQKTNKRNFAGGGGRVKPQFTLQSPAHEEAPALGGGPQEWKPVLPPITPGERLFWDGGRDRGGDKDRGRERAEEEDRPGTPMTASSVGTSILFPDEEEEEERRREVQRGRG